MDSDTHRINMLEHKLVMEDKVEELHHTVHITDPF